MFLLSKAHNCLDIEKWKFPKLTQSQQWILITLKKPDPLCKGSAFQQNEKQWRMVMTTLVRTQPSMSKTSYVPYHFKYWIQSLFNLYSPSNTEKIGFIHVWLNYKLIFLSLFYCIHAKLTKKNFCELQEALSFKPLWLLYDLVEPYYKALWIKSLTSFLTWTLLWIWIMLKCFWKAVCPIVWIFSASSA